MNSRESDNEIIIDVLNKKNISIDLGKIRQDGHNPITLSSIKSDGTKVLFTSINSELSVKDSEALPEAKRVYIPLDLKLQYTEPLEISVSLTLMLELNPDEMEYLVKTFDLIE